MSRKPILDTTAKTLTFPKGSVIISTSTNGFNHISLTEDVVFAQADTSSYGTAFCVLNAKTQEHRTVNANVSVVLTENEVVLAMVRWSECVYQANFSEYYLDGGLVTVKPIKDYNGLYFIRKEDLDSGYYATTPSIGDAVSENLGITSHATFLCKKISAVANSIIKIRGLGGSGDSRLYVVVQNGIVTDVAEAGEDTRNNPKIIEADKNTTVYISFDGSSGVGSPAIDFTIKLAQLSTAAAAAAAAAAFKDYAEVVSRKPILDTTAKTLTFPKGSVIISTSTNGFNHISLTEDVVFAQADTSSYGTAFCVLNAKTQEHRTVNANVSVVLTENEVVLAMVRWSECVYQANFSEYYLDDELIEFKPKSISVSRLTKTKVQDCALGYFSVSSYSVGDTVVGELSPLPWPEETSTYKYLKFIAGKASTIKIRGLGGSGDSRLYMIVDRTTKLVTHIAEAGENTLSTPISIPIENESDVYITFINASTIHNVSISYADYIVTLAQLSTAAAAAAAAAAAFKDYAEVVSRKPILDTTAKTLTFPKGSVIISTSTNGFNHISLTEDVVFAQADTSSYGTAFCVLNAKTQEHRTVNANVSVVLTENEVVLAMVRWSECVYQANFSEYYLDGGLVTVKPIKDYNGLYFIRKEDLDSGYYATTPSIGDAVSENLGITSHATFLCKKISAVANSIIKIRGLGGSGDSRLYVVVQNGIVTDVAEAGEDTRNNPKIIEADKNTTVYISFDGSSGVGSPAIDFTIKLAQLSTAAAAAAAAAAFKDYAEVVSRKPILDTTAKTLTFPKGSVIISTSTNGFNHISLTEDVVFAQADTSSYGTAFCVLNAKTQEHRTVNANVSVVLTENEVVLAMVRWSECVYQANFSEYYLDDELIEFKPKSISVSRLTKTKVQDCALGYFSVSSYSVGDTVVGELSPLPWPEETSTYKYLKFIAGKASTIKIRGLGGSGDSRLYMIVDRTTKLVTHIAEAGENTLSTPISIPIENESDVYITFINASTIHNVSISYADYIVTLAQLSTAAAAAAAAAAAFKDYAEVVSRKPILDTTAKTLTFPKGSVIISTSTNGFNHISLTEDVVFAQADTSSYGTAFCVLNAKTQEHRTVNANVSVVLTENEVVLAMVRWSECVYQANFSEYYLDGGLVTVKPIKDYNGLYFIRKEDLDSGYYATTPSIGDAVSENLGITSHATFLCKKISAVANSIIKIRGLGGSGDSRLYVVVQNGIVTDVAEAGEDTRNNPKIIEADKNTTVYISFDGSSGVGSPAIDFTIKLAQLSTAAAAAAAAAAFKDYAEVVSRKPILDTTAKTLTFPKGSVIISTSTNGFNHISLTEDVVFAQADTSSYGTAFCVLNAKTQEHRTVNANVSVVLTENEVVLAMVRWSECVYQANFSEYYLDDELIVFKSKTKVSTGVTAPHMFNPILNLQKTQLRVLNIGNSYTEDSTHYIPEIVSASGVDVSDMCLYKATRGGASFKNWYDIYHNQDTAGYGISRVVGGLSADISGTAAAGNGEKFRNTLANNEWDLIIIHQVSTYAPYYDRWEENYNAGYLSKFIRLLRKHQPKATIGFLLVHSYWSGYSVNTEKSSLQRWKLIAESAKKLRANYGIDFIIPYGTAIQNLRASSLNNEYDLTADGTHCANGLADYTAACAYYQALFAPRYGVNILGNTARITVSPTETYPSSDISVTDENAPVAQKAAFLASYNWYDCINPDDIDDEDLI